MRFPNIDAERRKAHLSKRKLCIALGIKPEKLQGWQDGRLEIKAHDLVNLARLFDTTPPHWTVPGNSGIFCYLGLRCSD